MTAAAVHASLIKQAPLLSCDKSKSPTISVPIYPADLKLITGNVIREHPPDARYRDLGRILYVDNLNHVYYWLPFPEKDKNGAQRNFIKDIVTADFPTPVTRASITASCQGVYPAQTLRTFHEPELPGSMLLREEELKANSKAGLTWKTRRDLPKWVKVRDEQFEWVKPFFVEYSMRDIVTLRPLVGWAQRRRLELGFTTEKKIVRAARQYMLGGCEINALLPNWGNTAAVGKPKYPVEGRSRQGAKNVAIKRGIAGHEGIQLTLGDRENIRRGWKKYKTGRRSVEKAYRLFLQEFYPQSVCIVSRTQVEVTLLPENERPTMYHFRQHGCGGDPARSASRVNLGAHKFDRTKRGLRGTARDGLAAAGQSGWIDSTPDDQNMCSHASRIKRVSTSYNTKVLEGYTDYILGIHSGFEKPSTMTALIAVGHAASEKEDFCKFYNWILKPGRWIAFCPRLIRADNGELKSATGIAAMTDAEISAEFVRSYAGEMKGPVEAANKSIAAHSSHQIVASNQGKRWERGDARPEDSFSSNHHEYMWHLIGAIDFHNNEDPVPHLLTIEMLRDSVRPYRGDILKWMIASNYVVSEPKNIGSLKARCLPRLKAGIYGNGLQIFDPRASGTTRLIPKLRYWSEWLHESRLTEKGRANVIHVNFHLNPSNLSQGWLPMDGQMHRLELQTNDPLLCEVTLLDWLSIRDDELLRAYLDGLEHEDAAVSRLASIEHSNSESTKARAAEQKANGKKPSKRMVNGGIRINTQDEIEAQNRT